jgi:hypothetical protein
MDPIGSPYSDSSSFMVRYAEDKTRFSDPGGQTPLSSVDPAGKPTTQNGAADAQMGIRRSGTGADEFKAYGPTPDRKDAARTPGIIPGGSDDKLPTRTGDNKESDPQIQQEVARLKAIEQKVKAHEAAHKSAGGPITGPISYSYTRGPDGRNYITGGEVPISISSGRTPQETINRMQQVIQAALAPADPSPQDRAVAAQAAAMQVQARSESAQTPANESATGENSGSSSDNRDEPAPQAELHDSHATAPHKDNKHHQPFSLFA